MTRLTAALCVLLSVKIACAAVGELKLEENFLELKPMFIENNQRLVNEKNLELKEFFDKYNICETILQKYERLLLTANNYIHRFVSLFLINFGSFNEELKDSNEIITLDIEITISFEDLLYLKSFSRDQEKPYSLKDLSRLDDIFSKAVRRKEHGYLKEGMRLSISFVYSFCLAIYQLLVILNNYNLTSYVVIIIVTWLIYCFLSPKSFYIYLSIMINSMIFWDSLMLYKKKIKEGELELEQLKLQKMPPECDPANSRWYYSVMNIFTGDRCVEYYKMLNRKITDDVSLFKCIIDTYLFYAIQIPIKFVGASIRDFTGEISALWPKPIAWIVSIPLLPFTTIVVVFLILILCGKQLRLSFFGASVEIGNSALKETRIINKTGPKLISNYRPLRVLGKSKLFRRSEIDFAKEKKLNVKNSKSEGAIGNAEVMNAQPSTESNIEVSKKED